MRLLLACTIVVLSVLGAIALTRINALTSPTMIAANAPGPKPVAAPKSINGWPR